MWADVWQTTQGKRTMTQSVLDKFVAKFGWTVPIENILPIDEFSREYTAFSRSFPYPRDLVQIHKDRLGKQSATLQVWRRMHVWHRPNFTVFVNNYKGVCFEVPEKTTTEQARQAWMEYREEMGSL